jgi:hypothetical protein
MPNPSVRDTDSSVTTAQPKTWRQRHSALLVILIFCAVMGLMIVIEKRSF